MTVKRDLKKRVRARQAETGERYTTALEKVRAAAADADRPEAAAEAPTSGMPAAGEARKPAVPVIEMVDLTALAHQLHLHGQVLMFPHLAERVEARATLLRIREVLLATREDPATDLLRRALLQGQPLPTRMLEPGQQRARAVHLALFYGATLRIPTGMESGSVSEGARFLGRARAGLGGVSEDGRMLALSVQGHRGIENVVGLLWGPWQVPGTSFTRPQTLVLGAADAMVEGTGDLQKMVDSGSGQP